MALTKNTQPAIRPTSGPTLKSNIALTPAEMPMTDKSPITKRDRLRARLEHPDGATLKQLEQEFNWQPHTVRAAISGLRKAGLEVQRGKGDTSSAYRIVTAEAA